MLTWIVKKGGKEYCQGQSIPMPSLLTLSHLIRDFSEVLESYILFSLCATSQVENKAISFNVVVLHTIIAIRKFAISDSCPSSSHTIKEHDLIFLPVLLKLME